MSRKCLTILYSEVKFLSNSYLHKRSWKPRKGYFLQVTAVPQNSSDDIN